MTQSTSRVFRIAAIPADGVGHEVVGRRAAGPRRHRRGFARAPRVRVAGVPWGSEYYEQPAG